MFKHRNVIITGGSSGLGKILAQRLVQRGANLALIARDEKKLKTVQEELSGLKSSDQKLEIFSCDVSDFVCVERTLREIVNLVGLPHLLINSAGILREGYFEKIPLETFQEVMAINYFGTLNCIKAVLPYFKKSGRGRIVNICSMAGLMGAFGYSAYCSSKFAVAGLTETLRAELKPQNIKFHLVCPPEFESPMVDELNKSRTKENLTVVHTMPVLSAESVADSVLKGIQKGNYLIIPGKITSGVQLLNRFFPGLTRAFIDWRIKKVYQGH